MGTIGERAAKAIKQHAKQNGIKIKEEAERLGIVAGSVYGWNKGRNDPSAYYLKQMYCHGYDVIWILTGKEQK